MLDINVKTIDGQNRSYSVPDNYTVKQFKEKIANSMNIPIERQRLIFQGKELKDANSLSEFDVNGKTLHLVQRIPPTQNQPATQSTSSRNSSNERMGGGGFRGFDNLNSPAGQGNNQIPDFVQQLIGGLGELGQNATFTNNGDMNNMEVHIDLGNVSQLVNDNEIRSRIRNIRRFLTMAQSRLNRLEEIQSGAPLDDSSSSTIIVGSIHTTASIRDANGNTTNSTIIDSSDPASQLLGQHIFSSSIPFSTIINTMPSQQSSTTTPQPQPAPPAPNTNNETQEANATNNTNNTNTLNDSESNQQESQQQSIGVDVLAELIKSVMDAYNKFQPYLQHYHQMLLNDLTEPTESPTSTTPTSALPPTTNANIVVLGDNRRQRFANNINDMMHLLGHLFHNLSDLHINLRDRPPRQMHTMNSMQHSASAIIGATAVPVEASIQIPISMTTTTTLNNSSSNPSQAPTSGTGQSTQNQPPIIMSSGSLPPFPFTQFIRARSRSSNSNTSSPGVNEPRNTSSASPSTNQSGFRYHRRQPPTLNRLPFSPAPSSSINNNNNNYSTLNSYDQFLPCNSVHFYNSANPVLVQQQQQQQQQHQRRRHPAGDQHQSPQSVHQNIHNQQHQQILQNHLMNHFQQHQQAQTGTQGGTPAPGQPAGQNSDISRLITNILSSTLSGIGGINGVGGNTNMDNVRVNIGGVPGQISIATISSTSPPGAIPNMRPQPNVTNSSPANLIEQLFGNMMGSESNMPNPTAPSNNSTQSSPTMPSNNVTHAILREAMNLMDNAGGNTSNNEQRLNQPLREFIRLFGEFEDDEEEENDAASENQTNRSSLNILNTFFQSLSLGDMINLARGQNRHQVFERTRQPLREYLKKNHSIEENSNEASITSLVDRLYYDIFLDENGLNLNLNQFELNDPNIDFSKSFEKLMKYHLKKMIVHILDSSYNNNTTNNDSGNNLRTWSSVLFDEFQQLIDRMVALNRTCIKNADAEFVRVVTSKLSEGITSRNFVTNPAFFNVFQGYIRSQIQQVTQNVNLTRSDIQEFVVNKQQQDQQQQTSEPTTSSLTSSEIKPDVKTKQNEVEENESDNKSSDQFDSASSTLSDHSMEIDQHFASIECLSKPPQQTQPQSSRANQPTSSNDQQWSSLLPSDWLPIIEKDIETQKSYKNTNGLRSFSDAYSSGMPSKRRKVLSSKHDLLTKNLFAKALNKTIDQIKLKPNANKDALIEASVNSSQLLDQFDSEFDSAIRERLYQDDDFIKLTNNDQNENSSSDLSNNTDRFKYTRKRFK